MACLCAALVVSACATNPDRAKVERNGPLTHPNESYIQVTKQKATWCYTRVIEGLPKDEICQKGDFIRYSPEPNSDSIYRPIPTYVMALFGTMSAMQAEAETADYRTESAEARAMRTWAINLQQ